MNEKILVPPFKVPPVTEPELELLLLQVPAALGFLLTFAALDIHNAGFSLE